MFTWLKNLFKRTEYRVIELEKHSPLPALTNELKDSLRTLQNHFGHQYIMQRLALERAALRDRFEKGFHATEAELRHYQAGIHWCTWLEAEIKRLTGVPKRVEHEIAAETHELFNKVSAEIELIR